MADAIELTVNGNIYTGWTEVRIVRALNQCASAFELTVTERWAGVNDKPWQIRRFDECTLSIAGMLVLTGYIDLYEPAYDSKSHTVHVTGRSKTCDLVDCMPDLAPDEFEGYKLDQIAKSLCAKFGIEVVVECDVGEAFDVVATEKTDTAFAIIENRARQRGVILTDNEKGNLVITETGSQGAAGSLIEGEKEGNIIAASAKLAGNELFSEYAVFSQRQETEDDDAQLENEGHATDGSVPRYRRHVEIAEDPLDPKKCQDRAEWRARHNAGASTEATLTALGFRQTAGGKLWKINQTSYVRTPRLAMDGQFLIGRTSWMQDDKGGSRTELLVAPPEAFTQNPDPKIDHSDESWKGVQKIKGGN
jgi:prophage tail gpP-like protein